MSPANQPAHEPANGPWAPARPGPALPAPSEPSGDPSGELPTDATDATDASEPRSAHALGARRRPHGGDPLDEEYGPL